LFLDVLLGFFAPSQRIVAILERCERSIPAIRASPNAEIGRVAGVALT
jgi:hypothetical protein